MTAILYALQLLHALPQLIAAGHDVTVLVQDAHSKLQAMHTEGRPPTPQEWDDLNGKIATLRAELHADETVPGSSGSAPATTI